MTHVQLQRLAQSLNDPKQATIQKKITIIIVIQRRVQKPKEFMSRTRDKVKWYKNISYKTGKQGTKVIR
jgi:hypothetical protein